MEIPYISKFSHSRQTDFIKMKFLLPILILMCQIFYTNELKFQFIGIFSICGDNFEKDEFTLKAFFANQSIYQGMNDTNYDFEPILYEYKSFDVCFDITSVAAISTTLLLDEEFNTLKNEVYKFQDKYFDVNRAIDAFQISKIVTVFTYVKEQNLKLLLELFTMTGIIVSKHADSYRSPDYMKEYPKFFDIVW